MIKNCQKIIGIFSSLFFSIISKILNIIEFKIVFKIIHYSIIFVISEIRVIDCLILHF